MKEGANGGATKLAAAVRRKRPYKSPALKDYGKLHLVTQGSGPLNGDAGQLMMIMMA